MIEVTLYTRQDCHLCEQTLQDLESLQEVVPHQVQVVDIDQDEKLQKKYGHEIPVVVAGPYTLRAPINHKDLEITLRAVQYEFEKQAALDRAIQSGEVRIPVTWGKADRFSLWLSRNYLLCFNLFIFLYVGLPFLAPVLMKAGLTTPAGWIYRSYGLVCHQLAFRSWFLFGEQAFYPRSAAHMKGVLSYGEVTGLDETDIWSAREFIGNPRLGYKIALCERDVSIYLGILMFGLLFSMTRRRIRAIPWYIWIAFGLVPVGLDGISQLISQPPLSLIPLRESTPLMRTITGWLFGFMTAWFGYPMAEESMRDTREFLEGKLKRYLDQSRLVQVTGPDTRK